ncbi:protein TBATA isoform X1 [Syngnathus scovelli]|uniref:protein TBATA isoform X1 n=1 Tax=Syngnathus scovelli TaxID=161590 RepID=UPI0021109C9E|nr:protein TBATA isoform X1 [Syngnathus scovelli]
MSGQGGRPPNEGPSKFRRAPATRGTPRFGALSHHSFFSRHNPHPHRVRHIQGLNGRPVCTVRDDWLVSSSLFPHPLLKSLDQRRAGVPALAFTPHQAHCDSKASVFSEAWRDELRELAAKVHSSSQDTSEVRLEREPVGRQTQYSAQTGRLVPLTAKSHPCRHPSQRLDRHQLFQDQELMVLELLCQILQTDSLRAVQRWLLLAGHREKELVSAMIKQVDLASHRPTRLPVSGPSSSRPAQRGGWNGASSADKPETIGGVEVLEIHADNQREHKDNPESTWECHRKDLSPCRHSSACITSDVKDSRQAVCPSCPTSVQKRHTS